MNPDAWMKALERCSGDAVRRNGPGSAVPHPGRKHLADWLTNRSDDERRVYYNEPHKAVVPAHLQPQPERSLA